MFGQSQKHRNEDFQGRREAENRTEEARGEAIQEARDRHAHLRQMIIKRLDKAKNREKQAKDDLTGVWKELANSKAESAKANSALAAIDIDLKQLSAITLELVRSSSSQARADL